MLQLMLALSLFIAMPAPESVEIALRELLRVGPEGQGNAAAAASWKRLQDTVTAKDLPVLLRAIKDANPLAANWIRAAIDAAAERALREKSPLPAAQLEAFVKDLQQHPRARRLAYEWLLRVDAGAEERIIPTLLNDPSVEFRRDAVAQLMARAAKVKSSGDSKRATDMYRESLGAARDDDQIKELVKILRAEKIDVDLPRHFGFIMKWHLVGPFDNRGQRGFDAVYPPEKSVDLAATYKGKSAEIKWRPHRTEQEYGQVDLNRALGREKGVVAYAVSSFVSATARDVEIRLGTANAWKLWVNSKLLFSRDEYHHGTHLDHYIVKASLRAGANRILLKVCQNEQTEDWADSWRFQLRVCDATGTAILSADRRAAEHRPKTEEKKP